jgi:AraC-like DNA-binding protein
VSEISDLRPSPANYFHLIVRRFGDTPQARAAILEGTGVSEAEIDHPQAEIGIVPQLRQFDNMAALYGEGWLLLAPELWRPVAHGPLGVAVIASPDLGAAIGLLAKYVSAHAPNQQLHLIRGSSVLILRHEFFIRLPETQLRPMVEAVFLGTGAMVDIIVGSAQAAIRYEFAWPEPAYGERLKAALGGEVRWSAPANAIAIPKALLATRSPLANAALCRHAVELLDQSAGVADGRGSVKGRVERLLTRSDTGRVPSEVAARALGLSQRTLARRLAEAGVGYRDLVDAELRARARRWLDAGVLSRAEIGERLGFADASGFSRASRRWFKTV